MKNIFKWCLSQLLYVLQWHLKIFHFILPVLNLQNLYYYHGDIQISLDVAWTNSPGCILLRGCVLSVHQQKIISLYQYLTGYWRCWVIWCERQHHRQGMLPIARPVFQAHCVVDGARWVHEALMPPPGRVTLPPRPPHGRLLDSSDRAPPLPAMAPASPDWPILNAWSLLRKISLFL